MQEGQNEERRIIQLTAAEYNLLINTASRLEKEEKKTQNLIRCIWVICIVASILAFRHVMVTPDLIKVDRIETGEIRIKDYRNRIRLIVGSQEDSCIGFYDIDEILRTAYGVDVNGKPAITVYGTNDIEQCVLAVKQDELPHILDATQNETTPVNGVDHIRWHSIPYNIDIERMISDELNGP